MHHYKWFNDKAFEEELSKCCDVLKKHKKKVNASHKATAAMAEELEMQTIKVLPGWK